MKIQLNLFPGGVNRALTMSYDDGQAFDIRLAELFDEHGIKGTFHLNSGNLNKSGYLTDNDLTTVLKNHEISVHTTTHPFLNDISDISVLNEILGDKDYLESICNYPVRGMSYPYGQYCDHVINMAQSCGMEYSRTVEATNNFFIPENFLKWHPTTHHNGDLATLWDKFMNSRNDKLLLFYLWGHSYEFDRQNNWDVIENFCNLAGGHENIWYATNIEIVDYMNAVRRLVFSKDETMIQNTSAIDVWITANGEPVCIKSGSILRL